MPRPASCRQFRIPTAYKGQLPLPPHRRQPMDLIRSKIRHKQAFFPLQDKMGMGKFLPLRIDAAARESLPGCHLPRTAVLKRNGRNRAAAIGCNPQKPSVFACLHITDARKSIFLLCPPRQAPVRLNRVGANPAAFLFLTDRIQNPPPFPDRQGGRRKGILFSCLPKRSLFFLKTKPIDPVPVFLPDHRTI